MIRDVRRSLAICLALVVCTCATVFAAEPPAGVQVLKFDRVQDVSNMPANFRTCKSMYKRMKGDQYPTREGLEGLRDSGSSFMSVNEMKSMLKKIPADPSDIIILDLRNESHGYINGHGVSWYSRYKRYNMGLTAQAVERREQKLLADAMAAGTVDIATQAKNKSTVMETPIKVKSVQTERQLAESLGMKYYRIPIMDYHAPSRANIDQFIEFYKKLPKNAWIHTHCEAGVGRTTITLSMIDMIHNAGKLSYDTIMTRQVLLGGQDVRYSTSSDKYKSENYPKRAAFTKHFYDYAKAHPQLDMSYTDWCKQQGYEDT